MKKNYSYLFIALITILQSCAPSRFVEPLEKDELSVGGSFGGPVIDFGGPIPMPISSLEVGYGVKDNLTAFGAFHTTAAIFSNFQIDAGVTYKFVDQNKFIPNVSVSPSFNFIYGFRSKSAKFWPVVDLNSYWNYGERKNYFYLGINNYFELSKTAANNQPQPHHWLFSPQIGHITKGKNGNWQLTTEIKFLGPNLKNTYSFVPYKSILGEHGATGFFIGCRWIIGKNK